jgi:hypothetical protein
MENQGSALRRNNLGIEEAIDLETRAFLFDEIVLFVLVNIPKKA